MCISVVILNSLCVNVMKFRLLAIHNAGSHGRVFLGLYCAVYQAVANQRACMAACGITSPRKPSDFPDRERAPSRSIVNSIMNMRLRMGL